MHETATLHFDLSHLAPDQPFTLHAGSRRYDLVPHSRHSLARSRRDNTALGLLPDERITHFSGPVRLPENAPLLLRVTAPKRDPDELLDRLVLVSLYLPRRHRIAALARQRQQSTRAVIEQRTQPLACNIRIDVRGIFSSHELNHIVHLRRDSCWVTDVTANRHQVHEPFESPSHQTVSRHQQC